MPPVPANVFAAVVAALLPPSWSPFASSPDGLLGRADGSGEGSTEKVTKSSGPASSKGFSRTEGLGDGATGMVQKAGCGECGGRVGECNGEADGVDGGGMMTWLVGRGALPWLL